MAENLCVDTCRVLADNVCYTTAGWVTMDTVATEVVPAVGETVESSAYEVVRVWKELRELGCIEI